MTYTSTNVDMALAVIRNLVLAGCRFEHRLEFASREHIIRTDPTRTNERRAQHAVMQAEREAVTA